jgi:hypothetical protein
MKVGDKIRYWHSQEDGSNDATILDIRHTTSRYIKNPALLTLTAKNTRSRKLETIVDSESYRYTKDRNGNMVWMTFGDQP